MMTPERWRQVTEIFHAALVRDASARAQYLDHACAGDRALRAEVDAMIAAQSAGAQFGERPVNVSTVHTPRLATGAMIGSYRVERLIGTGGMGEVYRARDTRLRRDVAIKVLPAAFTSDADRLMRFEREARILAALNHAHIAAIYGLEETTDVRALILELVDGDTLAERLRRRPIPVDQALDIARQIAEALEAAHEHGIIHRDLKPANIKVSLEGVVKVLDFGLAKAFVGEGTGIDLSQGPTITLEGTREGMIAGSPAYMSPEQARGQQIDKRTDIWAFGCVLYEMLTATRAFAGDDVSDTLARVLMKDPDWDALPQTTPQAIHKLLRRCLAKDRRQRLSDAADVRLEIEDAQTAPAGEPVTVAVPLPHVQTWRRALAPTLTLLVGALIAGTAVWLTTRAELPRVTRTTITPPATSPFTIGDGGRNLAIAPDGTRLVYVGANGTQLVVRALDQLAPTVLGGLGAPTQPVFSPDGQWIAFFDGIAALKKVATTGGPAITLTRLAGSPRGASWGPDDTIIFAVDNTSTGLLRIAAAGGEPEVLTTQGRWPEMLPGGQAVLFTTGGATEQAQVGVLDLRTGARRVLLRGGSHAQYVPPGYLLYGVAGTLRAVAFDLERLAVVGAPTPVIEGVATSAVGAANVSVASDGTLVYVPGGAVARAHMTLVWVDRQGREDALGAPVRAYRYPRLSPDGTKIAVEVREQEQDIWIWDLVRQMLTRLTFGPSAEQYPVWMPDGQRLAFRSPRGGPFNLYWQAADGTGAVERLTESPNEQSPYAVTPDGRHLLLREDGLGTGGDLMMLALDRDRAPEGSWRGERVEPQRVMPLIGTMFNERNGEISPDGRSLAYESDESGREEIYVRPFPDVNAGRWQVSTNGGTRPLWARSGRELFYLAPDGALFGVSVAVEGRGRFGAGTPAKLVEGRYYTRGIGNIGRSYDVSLDGWRFLMIKESGGADETTEPSIVVVLNWLEELKRLVPR